MELTLACLEGAPIQNSDLLVTLIVPKKQSLQLVKLVALRQ